MIYTTLDTFYLSDEQLRSSPSRKDGVDEETEAMLRFYGCELIQESGILLELPQAVMATGQVLFHRFYCKKSFTRFNVKRLAASCVWLAAKLEESPRKIRDVVCVFHRMECRRESIPLEFLNIYSKAYEEMRLDLIKTERHLLKEMGFICHVEHPHKFVLNYLLQLDAPSELIQEGWSLANDSLRTTLCVRFKSEVVACGVVYAAARRFQVPLPENPPWWLAFQAEKAEIDEVCRVMALLYKQPKARYIEVCKGANPLIWAKKPVDVPSEPNISQPGPAAAAAAAAAVAAAAAAAAAAAVAAAAAAAAVAAVAAPGKVESTSADAEPPVSANGDVADKTSNGGNDGSKELNNEMERREQDTERDRDRRDERDRRDREQDRRGRSKERERERRDYRKETSRSDHGSHSRHSRRHRPY